MMRLPEFIASSMLVLLLLSGCSGSSGNPAVPSQEIKTKSSANSNESRVIWGLYDVTIDTAKGSIEAVPNRTAMFRANVNHIMEAQGPKHLKFSNMDLDKLYDEGRISLDVGLEHPFPGLDLYTGFDVWGVFMHDGSGTLTYDGLDYPIEGTDAILENADGYTRWFNMGEFTASKILGYTAGVIGSPGFAPTANLNGYKVFADDLEKNQDLFDFLSEPVQFENRLYFRAGNLNWRHYDLRFPFSGGNPVVKFQYAVHASWVPPTVNPPMQIPGDFSLGANIQEACALSCIPTETPWFNDPSDWGGNLGLDIRVYDWQGALENPAGIPGEIAGIKVAGTILPSTWSGDYTVGAGSSQYSIVHVEIPESALNITSDTGNECWVIVESSDPVDYSDSELIPSGSYPSPASLAAFVRVPITLSEEPQPQNMDLIDITPPGWPAVIKDVWVDGNVAYGVGPYGGLITFDISGTGNPVYLGGHDTDGQGEEVQVEGGYCYVADGDPGLVVFDVSDPADPAQVGSYVGTNASGLFVANGYVYLADGKGGLKILDVGGGTQGGSPSNPKLEGTYTVGYAALDVIVLNGIAYVTDYETAFLTIDVGGGTQGGSPSNPKLEGSLKTLTGGDEITLYSGYAYVADNQAGYKIDIVDVNTPSNPQFISSVSVSSNVYDLWINGQYLYTACDTSGLRVYSLPASEPPIPSFISQYNTDGNSTGVYKTGNYAYVADYQGGLLKIDVSNPASPTPSGKYFTPHDPYDLWVGGGYVYTADGGTGLGVTDIGDPTNPLTVGQWNGTGEDCRGVWVENGYAYLSGGWFNKHFFVVDVGGASGAPNNPKLLSDITTPTFQGTLGLMKMGSYVYATAWEDGLKVFDVDGGALGGTPSNPKYVTTYSTNTSWGLWADSGYVYLADGNNIEARFYVFDVGGGGTGSPTAPKIADSVITPNHNYDVELVSGYAFVCGGDGLAVYDVGASIGAPDDIQQVGSYDIGYPILCRGLCIFKGYAFIACSTGTLYAVDVGGGEAGGSPTNPQLVDSIDLPGDCFDVWCSGNYAYVAGFRGGLRIIQIW